MLSPSRRAAVVIVAAACSAVAQTPGSYVGWTATGTASYNPFSPAAVNGFLGAAVAVVGDLNGDGVDDVLAQAGIGAFLHALSGVDGTTLYTMTGTLGSDLGRAVARMPDLNADGTADFVVGTPGHSSGGFSANGRVELRSGATGAALWTVLGVGASARLGGTVAEIGDVDLDGFPDVGVGASGSIVLGGPTTFGYALVLSGATGATIRSYASPPGYTVGGAIAKLGDLDLDGVVDAVFTASYFATGGPIVCGSAFASVMSGATGAPLLVVAGPLCDGFGATAAGLGDATGDGVPDFAVGAPDYLVSPLGPGAVTFFSGATGAAYATATTATPGSYYASSLVGGFDFDADGDPDLAVGVPELSVSGGAGRVEILDAGAGAIVAVLTPHLPTSFRFGSTFGAGDDLTGDGVADLVVGAAVTSTAGLNMNGAVTVRSRFGLAAGGARYGAACAGGLPHAPALSFVGGGPNVTTGAPAFGLAVTAAPGFGGAMLVVGGSNTTWAGGALPFQLSAVGLSACPLLASPDLLFFSDTSGGGATVFPFPLAPSPGLAGLTLYAQAYVATSAAPLAGGVTTGLAITLQ